MFISTLQRVIVRVRRTVPSDGSWLRKLLADFYTQGHCHIQCYGFILTLHVVNGIYLCDMMIIYARQVESACVLSHNWN
jgi:hypothetical protein